MPEPRATFVDRLRRQAGEALLAASAEGQHGQAKYQQHQAPPKVGVDAEAGVIDGAAPRGQAEGGEDHADQREHQAHGDA